MTTIFLFASFDDREVSIAYASRCNVTDTMIDEQIVMEIGRVFIASGNLEHSIRGYLSLALNDRFAEIGQATVCKISLDLLEVVCQILAFSKWEELGDLKKRINADKFLRNLLAHASFHEDSEGVARLNKWEGSRLGSMLFCPVKFWLRWPASSPQNGSASSPKFRSSRNRLGIRMSSSMRAK